MKSTSYTTTIGSLLLSLVFLASCARHTPRPPDSPPSEPAMEEEVSFPSGDLTLRGLLSVPQRQPDARLPAIVLVHGSGPQGRDVVLPLNFPQAGGLSVSTFRDLAEKLSANGYVVLRYDKRTCGPFNKRCDNDYPLPEGVLVSHFEADASAGLDFLATRVEVDPSKMIVIGHSQGASFVPRLLSQRKELLAGVLLAPGYRPVDQLLSWQIGLQRELAAQTGMTSEQVDAAFTPLEQTALDLAALRSNSYTGDALDPNEQQFWLEWMTLCDEVPDVARTVSQPMLVLSGDYDWNTPPAETEAWATLFSSLPQDPGHKAEVLPCVTHALNCVRQPDWLQVQPDDVETTVSDQVVAMILEFLEAP